MVTENLETGPSNPVPAFEGLIGVGDDRAETHRARRVGRDFGAQDFGGIHFHIDVAPPGQARQVAQIADGVIVGSRIVQYMEAEDDLTSVGNFIKELRHALDELSEEEKL